MKHKMLARCLALAACALSFILFDLWFYHTFTVRFINDHSDALRAKSVELDRYLPFSEDTAIVKSDATLKFSVEQYERGELPVIDGAAALYPVFSAFVHAVYPEDAVIFDGSDFTAESCLKMNNTINAYREIVDGEADIVICAPPSDEQLAYAGSKGVELEMVPIGREAFVFLVNSANPVESVSMSDLKDIYSGRIRNWSSLGGMDKRIEPLQRNRGSGSQTSFLKIMGEDADIRPYFGLPGSAIGFSFRYYVSDVVKEGGVKMLAVDGHYPDKDNIVNGDYPFVSSFYAVCRASEENENVHALIEWMLSEEGQAIIDETGYVRVE